MANFLKTLLITVLLASLVAACSPATEAASDLGRQGYQTTAQSLFERDALESYASAFQIQFNGATSWSYQITTRKSPALLEINLHLDGLSKSQNPGDIRLVTDGKQSWMIGPGTDGECIQFPNQQGMDPTFIFPETLISLDQIRDDLKVVGEEAGDPLGPGSPVTLQHYQASDIEAGPWKIANIETWQEKDSHMLRQFSMQADGEDPFFTAGAGGLTASYQTSPLDDQPIEPVPGCEINVRLPESAGMFVRLPGMASFETPSRVEEVQQFYQTIMPQENWTEASPAGEVDGAVVLSYRREAEEVEIVIETLPAGGSRVKILFLPEQ